MQNFMVALLICSVTMAVLALLYLAAAPFLAKRYSAKGRYYAWLVIIVGLIIPFRPSFGGALVTVEMPAPAPPPITQITTHMPPLVTGTQPPISTAGLIYNEAIVPGFAISWWQAAFFVWLAGVIVFLALHGIRHYRFLKMVRRWRAPIADEATQALLQHIADEMNITRRIALFQCPFVGSPMMIGLFRPQILLPTAAIAPEELRFIFRHELVHYARNDLLYKLLVLLATALHWFNPIVYLAGRAINILCETSCDAAVLQAADHRTRQSYGEIIIDVVQYQAKLKTALSTSFYGGKTGMKTRILSIMDTRKKKIGAALVSTMLLAVVIVGGLFAVQADEGYRYEDFDDHDPAYYVAAQTAHPPEAYAPAQPAEETDPPQGVTNIGGTGEYVLTTTPYGLAITFSYWINNFPNLLPGHTYLVALFLDLNAPPANNEVALIINGNKVAGGYLSLPHEASNPPRFSAMFRYEANEPITSVWFAFSEVQNLDIAEVTIFLFVEEQYSTTLVTEPCASIFIDEILPGQARPVARLAMNSDSGYHVRITVEEGYGHRIFTGLKDYFVDYVTQSGMWFEFSIGHFFEAGGISLRVASPNLNGLYYFYVGSGNEWLRGVRVDIYRLGDGAAIYY